MSDRRGKARADMLGYDTGNPEPAQLTIDGKEEPLDEGPVSEPTSGPVSDGAVSGPSSSGSYDPRTAEIPY